MLCAAAAAACPPGPEAVDAEAAERLGVRWRWGGGAFQLAVQTVSCLPAQGGCGGTPARLIGVALERDGRIQALPTVERDGGERTLWLPLPAGALAGAALRLSYRTATCPAPRVLRFTPPPPPR
ncbi:MAG: hypothetical protein KatS3mg121_0150 [Gammaproteobacteria bacterium]|nr:MAG: hypothetical protein KatS3mg121_0150 [Gammaproteobacteria bacterium]